MASEPPPEYVAFVERHLEPLRDQCGRVVGDVREADLLYPEVLAQVASRWEWIELRRVVLHKPTVAEAVLEHTLSRISNKWQATLDEPVEARPEIQFSIWDNDDYQPPPVPLAVSNAVKLAPALRLPTQWVAGALCEATIAWCHRDEIRRRRRYWIIGVGCALFLALVAHVSTPPA
jgi:hypothetical protein